MLVVTNDDESGAVSLAKRLAKRYWDKRVELQPETISPSDAVRRGKLFEDGPVLLVETADCCGGGATGDSVHTLRTSWRRRPSSRLLFPWSIPLQHRRRTRPGLAK